MAKTYAQLVALANEIRTATQEGENTAERVGYFLTEALEYARACAASAASSLAEETSARQAVDSSLSQDISGLTSSIVDLWAAVNSKATQTALQAVLSAALGAGTETAFRSTMKRQVQSSAQLNATLNNLIIDRKSDQTNGVYKFHHSGGHMAVLLMLGNCNTDTPTANHYRTQVVIGDVKAATGEGYPDTDKGFSSGIMFSANIPRILSRQIKYTGSGTAYSVVSQWASIISLVSA